MNSEGILDFRPIPFLFFVLAKLWGLLTVFSVGNKSAWWLLSSWAAPSSPGWDGEPAGLVSLLLLQPPMVAGPC